MKIRTDFVTNSSSSSFILVIDMELANNESVRFEANGGTDETGRIDYFRYDAIVKVSPKQLSQAESVEALIQMLEDGVVDGQVKNYDEKYEQKIFDRSRVEVNDWDEEFDAYDFVEEIRSKITDVGQIKKITISGEEDGDSYYFREYVYDVETGEYTGRQIGEAFQANGSTGGDLRISDLDLCKITYDADDDEEEEDTQEEILQLRNMQEEGNDGPNYVETENGAVINNIKYAITSETTCKVVGCEWGGKEAIIPAEVTIKGKPYKVTAVGASAFSVSTFGHIELPVGITEIEDNALECWFLQSVKLPDGLITMGDLIFNGCSKLEEVEIPDSVKSIGLYTFRGCQNLKKVKLSAGLEELSDSLFCGCKSLESIEIPDSVTKLGEEVFSGCEKLKKVKLPTGLLEIDRLLFNECKSLESIEIPDTVKSIGNYAFCKCEKLTAVDLPSGLVSVGEGAFKDCRLLEHIELPQSMTELGDMAFAGCPSLGEVTLPSSIVLEEINYGFEEDSSKEVVDEPENGTESEFQYSKKDKMFMNSVPVEEEIKNIWAYRGELVKLYPDKLMIGDKELPADSKKEYFCENDVLTCKDEENFYVYDGEQFVQTECKYRNHNSYFSPDIFCSAAVDWKDGLQCVALTDHGEESTFKYSFKNVLAECFYFEKPGVLFFVSTFHAQLRFFSKAGEELWFLEKVTDDGFREPFSYVIDTLNMDVEGDGIIIKVQKGEQCYTVCYRVENGEVMWYRKDNHPFLFSGAKCEDGLMRGVFPYYDDGEYCTVMFELNPSNGKAQTYRISAGEKAQKVTVEGFDTRSVVYKYIVDGEILYVIGTEEIFVIDTNKKVILSKVKAPENVPYRQADAVLFEGKLYVCEEYDGWLLPVWKCYELSDKKLVAKK